MKNFSRPTPSPTLHDMLAAPLRAAGQDHELLSALAEVCNKLWAAARPLDPDIAEIITRRREDLYE